MSPEEKARLEIDRKLELAGYVIQDMKEFDPTASLGVAVREYPTNVGEADYVLFVDRVPVGVIEAKATDKGEKLIMAADQSSDYAKSGLKYFVNSKPLRFTYEATDILTHFCDLNDANARTRQLFSFHKPETLRDWLKDESTLRNQLKTFSTFDNTNFRDCQTKAIINLEKSFAENRPRALIQMATGAGKTFTAITSVYRLLKHADAKRILFLVDTKNLGEQAEEEFRKYAPNDDARLFPELYNIQRLTSSYIPTDTHVCISTIQRMYSILRGEELDESAENESLNEQNLTGNPREVVYNPKYPPEFFDFIIIDECHRSIYNLWQQVLDYFDAFLIGLTATPDSRTFGFFNENVVSEYTHEQAVIDGVNVGREGTYLIETEISKKGNVILKQVVQRRERLSRRKRWEQLDEDVAYKPTQLDKDVVNPSQIRNIIRAFKEKVLTEMFPFRKEIPKTLVFAKTDSHANDIISIIREEFGEGNEFCKKITYGSIEDPKSILNAFRNDYYPRIAVTVDMIATGTDVKPIECLLFLRDVRSSNYYEQMLGRATRTLDLESLKKVSPSATEKKLGYVLVDAVGVTASKKGNSRQLERKPSVSLKDLMMNVATGSKDEDIFTSLANRLITLDRVLTPKEKEKVQDLNNRASLSSIASNLLDVFDEDKIREQIEQIPDRHNYSPTVQEEKAMEILARKAVEPICSPQLREFILNARKAHDQIIDPTLDKITKLGWKEDIEQGAEDIIHKFRQFIEDNKDEITALNIIYSQTYRNRPLTLQMIEELYTAMQRSPYFFSVDKLWQAYSVKFSEKVKSLTSVKKLIDIVSIIRFELGYSKELDLYAAEVNLKYRDWIFAKRAGNPYYFTPEQDKWLQMIRDHIAVSLSITKDDLNLAPFDDEGGLGKFYQLFGNKYEEVLEEINEALAA
ncbi:MAG: restriction endonuclease subunit R [Bacteroidia bacterium 44-10]|nr:MAG: restriction endonuclease subunit R [Bacteroidia bacterium 44-10]